MISIGVGKFEELKNFLSLTSSGGQGGLPEEEGGGDVIMAGVGEGVVGGGSSNGTREVGKGGTVEGTGFSSLAFYGGVTVAKEQFVAWDAGVCVCMSLSFSLSLSLFPSLSSYVCVCVSLSFCYTEEGGFLCA